MRSLHIAFIVVAGLSIEASASPRGGGTGSGGGRLSQVSAGIGGAASSGSGARGQRGTTDARDWAVSCPNDQYRRRVYDGLCVRRCPEGELYRVDDGVCARPTVAVVLAPDTVVESEAQTTMPSGQRSARVSMYLGAQKVFESDGAVTLELAVADRWLRLGGALTRFYEPLPSGDTLTLTMPSLALGVRIDDSATTRVYLEAGVVGSLTKNDPRMDTSITGALGGVHAEYSLSKHTMFVGAAKLMAFQHDIRAASIRAGVRYRHVQASFSVLDFNVGPALFGPEFGVGF